MPTFGRDAENVEGRISTSAPFRKRTLGSTVPDHLASISMSTGMRMTIIIIISSSSSSSSTTTTTTSVVGISPAFQCSQGAGVHALARDKLSYTRCDTNGVGGSRLCSERGCAGSGGGVDCGGGEDKGGCAVQVAGVVQHAGMVQCRLRGW